MRVVIVGEIHHLIPPTWGGTYPPLVDNSLPGSQPGIDNSLPGVPPGIWGGAPSYPDNSLPVPPGMVRPPMFPTNPIVIPPDAIAPGVPSFPIYLPPSPMPPIHIPPSAGRPPGIWGGGNVPMPMPPIALPVPPGDNPPVVDNSLPGGIAYPDNSLPVGFRWELHYSPVYGWILVPVENLPAPKPTEGRRSE